MRGLGEQGAIDGGRLVLPERLALVEQAQELPVDALRVVAEMLARGALGLGLGEHLLRRAVAQVAVVGPVAAAVACHGIPLSPDAKAPVLGGGGRPDDAESLPGREVPEERADRVGIRLVERHGEPGAPRPGLGGGHAGLRSETNR
ncbi:hypothetical protein GCM10008965_55650 [Methylorubrum aminovorans]|nr:hypothetical protein GCM10025880_32460 [Methylorubrum aminovorans]